MTVTFRTRRPNAAFPHALTEPSAAVVKQGTASMPVIMSGLFRFVSSDPNKRLVGRAYDLGAMIRGAAVLCGTPPLGTTATSNGRGRSDRSSETRTAEARPKRRSRGPTRNGLITPACTRSFAQIVSHSVV
jgi:hypothetical protein